MQLGKQGETSLLQFAFFVSFVFFVVQLGVIDAFRCVEFAQSAPVMECPNLYSGKRMSNLSPLRILVVDDDPDTRSNLVDILQLDGYEVETAGTMAQTLARTDWDTLSVIILDRRLPDGSAEELLPQLKRLAPRADIVIVTGYADLEGAIAAIRQGAADYLLKPINLELFAPVWPTSPNASGRKPRSPGSTRTSNDA